MKWKIRFAGEFRLFLAIIVLFQGGCKQISRRLKQTGARWKRATVNRMVHVTTALRTQVWDTF